MPTERRSPWFNARTQPPVNGGDDARYEHRCASYSHGENWTRPMPLRKEAILNLTCFDCQWRGLLREDGERA